MDILDIVRKVVNKNEDNRLNENWEDILMLLRHGSTVEEVAQKYEIEVELITNRLATQNDASGTNEESNHQESQSLSQTQIQEIIIRVFTGETLDQIADDLHLDKMTLENELNKYNYIKRWILKESHRSQSNLNKVLIELNTTEKTLEDVSNQLSEELITLKNALREIWVLETARKGNESYAAIDSSLTLVTNADDGKLKYIEYKGKRVIISLQVNSLLGINSGYYFNVSKDQFIENIHYVEIDKVLLKKVKGTVPYLDYLVSVSFYTKAGLELFERVTNRKGFISSNKLEKLFGTGVEEESQDKVEENTTNQNVSWKEIKSSLERLNQVRSEDSYSLNDDAQEPGKVEKTSEEDPQLKYSYFFNEWSKDGEEGILKEIVQELNKGKTIYDISKRYTKNRKYRAKFAGNLQSKLEKEGYLFNKDTKKWESEISEYKKEIVKIPESKQDEPTVKQNIIKKEEGPLSSAESAHEKKEDNDPTSVNNDAGNVEEIVAFLNKSNSIKLAEKKFRINSMKIRLLLKAHGYTYDVMFDTWSNKSRDELLKNVAHDLKNGITTFDELKKAGVYTKALMKKLEENGLEYKPSQIKDEDKEPHPEPLATLNPSPINNDTIATIKEDIKPLSKVENSVITTAENSLSNDEIFKLRKIIKEWHGIDGNHTEDEKVKSTFIVKNSLLQEIENYSEANEISKSKVVEKALEEFFINMK
ncbi:hypothetical protein ACJ2A9_21835 [Anaerobacillus sp. MEB173]|uniref:hypothetical protein n=1 Tax=Anaerobacillus sp. MEB173 TaxID=3383345 RepID=UPI003F8FB0B6